MKFELEVTYGDAVSTRHLIDEKLDVTIYDEEQYFEFIKKIRELLNI